MDADAYRVAPLDGLIEDNRDALLVLGDNRPWDDGANVGVWLVGNTPLACHILDEWWHVPIYDRRTAFDWPPEQRGMEWQIRPRWHADSRIVVIRNMRDFVIHMAGLPDHHRRDELEGYTKKALPG